MRYAIALTFLLSAMAHAAPPQAQYGQSARGAMPTTPDPSVNAQSLYQHNGGSLLKATLNAPADNRRAGLQDVSWFAVPEPEPKTLKKHDLVTIIIREESTATTTGKSDLKKSHDLDAELQEWVKLDLKNWAIKGGAQGPIPPALKYTMSRNFKGEGEVDRTDSFTFRVTAEVVDVKPNGTLVLQARKHIKTDDEEQEFVLSGVVSATSVTPDNTVLSTDLHDLDVTKRTTGQVRDTTKRGFFPKLLDALNPF